MYPLTDAGKLLAVAYMPLSIAVFSGLLAAFAKATFRVLIATTCDAEGRGLVTGNRFAGRRRSKALRPKRGERLVRGAAQVGKATQTHLTAVEESCFNKWPHTRRVGAAVFVLLRLAPPPPVLF